MRRYCLILLVYMGVLISSTSGYAEFVDPNQVGVFFSPESEWNWSYPAMEDSNLFVYISLIDPDALQIKGFEIGYEIVGDLGMIERVGEWLPPGSVQVGDSSNPWLGDYIVGLSIPLPAQEVVIVVTLEFEILSETGLVGFRLGPASSESIPDGRPAIAHDYGEITPIYVLEGNHFCWHFHSCINLPESYSAVFGHSPVSTQARSFGSVKSLFR